MKTIVCMYYVYIYYVQISELRTILNNTMIILMRFLQIKPKNPELKGRGKNMNILIKHRTNSENTRKSLV